MNDIRDDWEKVGEYRQRIKRIHEAGDRALHLYMGIVMQGVSPTHCYTYSAAMAAEIETALTRIAMKHLEKPK